MHPGTQSGRGLGLLMLYWPRSRPGDPELPNVGLFLVEKTAGGGWTLPRTAKNAVLPNDQAHKEVSVRKLGFPQPAFPGLSNLRPKDSSQHEAIRASERQSAKSCK